MALNAVLQSLDLLDAATVTGQDVAEALRAAGVPDVEVKRFTGKRTGVPTLSASSYRARAGAGAAGRRLLSASWVG